MWHKRTTKYAMVALSLYVTTIERQNERYLSEIWIACCKMHTVKMIWLHIMVITNEILLSISLSKLDFLNLFVF